MLGDCLLDVVLLATDLPASRELCARKLGLEIVSEDENAVWFKCGGQSRISISASTIGTADEQTQASWRVAELDAELAELRSRGVELLEYDLPGLKTTNGIADDGRVAWLKDPGGNMLWVIEYAATSHDATRVREPLGR